MIVGCYSLDLYCDNKDRHIMFNDGSYYFKPDMETDIKGWIPIQHQFSNETYGNCVKQARKAGWLVNRKKDKCLCAYCK